MNEMKENSQDFPKHVLKCDAHKCHLNAMICNLTPFVVIINKKNYKKNTLTVKIITLRLRIQHKSNEGRWSFTKKNFLCNIRKHSYLLGTQLPMCHRPTANICVEK